MQVSIAPDPIRVNQIGALHVALDDSDKDAAYWFYVQGEDDPFPDVAVPPAPASVKLTMAKFRDYDIEVKFSSGGSLVVEVYGPDDQNTLFKTFALSDVLSDEGPEPDFNVALVAAGPPKSSDEVLWSFISIVSRRMRFDEFRDFVQPKLPLKAKTWYGVDAYNELTHLANDFVARSAIFGAADDVELRPSTVNAALKASYVDERRKSNTSQPFLLYPYGKKVSAGQPEPDAPVADHAAPPPAEFEFPLRNVPFVELIWNYWTEEGMLVQTLNHILARFQNRRASNRSDPLFRLDVSPLMPLRALLWGFAEDEMGRLTVRRRAAEYEYEYGLRLRGRAVPPTSMLADRRSQFLEAFHRLLHACVLFYKEHDDKTIVADAFPLLSNLQEVHLILARGAHNQFANLATTARAEMLAMQWILAQPEMHEFLGGPAMVPYEEPWMDRVDTMKSLQGWSDTSITHFFELAVGGEQILLSVRHGRWNESTRKVEDAANWALTFRNPVQRYIHNYDAVTSINMRTQVDATMPSDLIARRLAGQRNRA